MGAETVETAIMASGLPPSLISPHQLPGHTRLHFAQLQSGTKRIISDVSS